MMPANGSGCFTAPGRSCLTQAEAPKTPGSASQGHSCPCPLELLFCGCRRRFDAAMQFRKAARWVEAVADFTY